MKFVNIYFFLSFLCGCTTIEIIDTELPFKKKELVVFCELKANNPIFLRLTHSIAPSGSIPKKAFVENAEVIIFENSKQIGILKHLEEGIYYSDFKPKEGEKYSFSIDAVGYNTASSLPVIIPSNLPAYTIEKPEKAERGLQNTNLKEQINIIFKRPELYEKHILYIGVQVFYNTDVYNQVIDVTIPDEVYDKKCHPNYLSYDSSLMEKRIFLVNSDCFSSPTFLKKIVYETERSTIVGAKQKATKIKYFVGKCSNEVYMVAQHLGTPEGLEQVFREPTPRFSNIENGQGLITAVIEKEIITSKEL